MKIKNINDLKEMTTDETVISMVAEVLVLQAKWEITKEEVEAYTKPIFESYAFYVENKEYPGRGRGDDRVNSEGRILDDKLIYLTDLNGKTYLDYCDAIREAHVSNDFAEVVLQHERDHNGDRGWCPALIAENEFNQAKNRLAKHVATEWLDLKDIAYPHSHKLVDLVIGACVNGPCGESLKDTKFLLLNADT